ncbi:amino acid adenylation domain-containing protein [Flavobacterium jejuense]|uniref:Amino acid adenylation domain-containing protein n=1 Tax=Flavobacterium jejuense TaxID=1544455 RepID=A0ABX0IQT4_9FLAO|nr:non-ribosomal peptide synthetase [Flavobacterium jejuense]NHN25908.1 amino acid adenylation domain-containing protein [Flavobacterium jejuense]
MERLLLELYKKNIKVNLDNGNLKLNIPKGIDAKDILEEVKKNKENLIAFINNRIQLNTNFKTIEPTQIKDYYVLSSAQKRLYFLYEFDKLSLAYNMPQTAKLKGVLDKNRLNNVFKNLITRYEILRTNFIIVNDEPVQQVLDSIDFEIEYFNATETEISQIIQKFIRPFNLNKDPLLRVGLIHLSNKEHLLILDMHHIITDGVSNGILIKAFMSLYNHDSLPDLRIQFKDYAEWQQSDEQQEQILKQKDFWLNQFNKETSVINLPIDFKRPKSKNYEGTSIGFELSKEKSNQLKLISERTNSTMFMTILSIYYILLNKITNQEDIIIGTAVAGRKHFDLEDLIGMFVNTLPLRNYPKVDLSFNMFLETVKSVTLECFENQIYPYESLLDELNIERDTSRNPLFDVFFSYQNFEEPELSIPGLTLSPYNSGHIDSKFDISLNVIEHNEKLFLGIEYSTELFKKEKIESIIGYFNKIVDAVIENRDVKIGDIDVLSEDEKHQLLFDFNNTKVIYPNDKTIINLLEEQVIQNGSKKALFCKNQSLTYDQLNVEVNQLSNYLIHSKGVKINDVIGIYTDRSCKMIIALLAVLKSGATYVYLDSEYPSERINTIIEESQLKLIVSNLSNEMITINSKIDCVEINNTELKSNKKNDKNPSIDINANDAAYVIYTSGSTGVPKGIIIEHSSLFDYCMTFKNHFSISNEDVIIQQSSLSFDTAIEEIFPALISGASIVILPSGGRDIDYMIKTITQYKATVLSTTPLVLNELNKHTESLVSLKVIISGGDLLLPNHVNNFIGKLPIYNTYGPSESTVCITYNKIEKLSQVSYIGKPIANREVFIINKNGVLCPSSVPGELCVSGKGLARGYLNNDLLTNDKFFENVHIDGTRMYRTGDLAKWLPDGSIAFLGRMDKQLKIRGYRVELGEIESQLILYSEVKESIVIDKEINGNKCLVAYYTSEKPIKEIVLREHLIQTLPEYMIPTYYVHLTKLPVTKNGKLDTKELPNFDSSRKDVYVKSNNETEEKLMQIWSEILNLEYNNISANISFFELGGNSLKAVFLINKLERLFNIKISLREIFNNSTIQSMAKIIEVHLCINDENKHEESAKTNKVII